MKSSIFVLGLVALGSLSMGCAAEHADDPAAASAEELITGPGVSFAATGDAALKVNVKVADGIKPKTKNKRFIRVTVARASKSFGMWCTGSGQIGQAGALEKIECSDSVETVSNDDDETFSMTIVKKSGAYEIESVGYMGDGTFYGDRMEILDKGWSSQGNAPDPLEHIALTPTKGEGSAADPFPMIADVGSRLQGLLGAKIPNDETGPLPAHSARFDLSQKMDLGITLVLSKTGRITATPSKRVSALKTPGDLPSGLATAAEVKARVFASL